MSTPSESTPAPESATDESKDKFLAALEAKKGKTGYGSENHATGGGSAKGKSAKAGGKREFRRKSG